ncbi:helix-turn-helix transcriptional regulator [Flavobacterium enshiense]|uniref:helix-turn-helix transcriptional regulator n=1 Tax=Flavobacterium enshiense TaxID=1341165 RepID=UPI000688195F|nr:helix-turn-helix domain-containing protein [Flavobacterium enshiense]
MLNKNSFGFEEPLQNEQTLFVNREFLTLEMAAVYLSMSKSKLYKLTSSRTIPFYNPGGRRIYFRKPELDSWILSSRVPCRKEDLEYDVCHIQDELGDD